jgi:branched-chain amino acid transport system ATP-binding protein
VPLELHNLSCGYGHIRAVTDLTMDVKAGCIVTLLGANGAGKTSTLQCIAGHVELTGGRILFDGEDISRTRPQQRVAAGIAIAPEGRRLFPDLTVRENLAVGGYCRPKKSEQGNLEIVLELFPRLHERLHAKAATLSGGEQQMATIGRALMSEPKLLMIDECSLGLMPKMVDICYEAFLRLKRKGLSLLLVEQSAAALAVADTVYVLESGSLVWQGPASQARNDESIIGAYLGTSISKTSNR